MKCPGCNTDLVRTTKNGGVMLHNRGILLKAGCLVFRCPTCKSDVSPPPEVMKTFQQAVVLFFSAPEPAQK